VTLEPPLETDLAVDDPSLSPAARAELAALAKAGATHHTRGALVVLVAGALPDPEAITPTLELLCRAARALRGQVAGGPFR
jgi:hypothetical protein